MHTKNFALIAGLVMLMMGLIAFLPVMNVTEGLPLLVVNLSYGMFLDIFPMNIFNKLTLVFFGVGGLLAYFTTKDTLHYSIMFSKIVFWAMGSLALLGLFPQSNTLFGYWPLFGFEIVAHAIFSLIGGYYGYIVNKEDTFHLPNRMHNI